MHLSSLRRGACAALVAAVLLLAAPVPTLAAGSSLQAMSKAFEALAGKASPAVVEILVTGYGPDGDEGDGSAPIRRIGSQGSGVIVDANGYILTNYHVIAGQQAVKVVITPRRGRESQAAATLAQRPRVLPAQVVGYSEAADLAVLKADAHDLPTIPFADYRALRQGQLVMAVGSPVGLQNSVSLGVVSAVLRQVDPDNPMVFIQTDAAINPGNSGGALVDVEGRLVGINASIVTRSGGNEGIGFAIPSSIARFMYEQIRDDGYVRTGYIGAVMQAITPELATALDLPETALPGIIVADVHPDSPAERAGLRIYDRIKTVDGAPATSVPTFVMNIFLRQKGDRVHLGIVRDNREQSIDVPVIELQPGPTSFADLANPATNLIARLGVVGTDLNPQVARFLPPPRIDSGVVVTALSSEYGGDASGLRQGDIIHALNAQPVTGMATLRAYLRALAPGEPAALQVERNGRLLFVTPNMN
ncbi:trypsin-like peptidase domain-containing protein [Dokdonella sp.]|uniref:trypsin-like peptidase domain-containing protein n=1 Tax=Dokdonella sp. TaxID=2291710 RepID=UPI0031C83F06|nr:trypsin-like peptidase domain-containing protein [Dokdonella sp.]